MTIVPYKYEKKIILFPDFTGQGGSYPVESRMKGVLMDIDFDPAWRWEKAIALADDGRQPHRSDDRYVWQGYRYLLRRRKLRTPADLAALRRDRPDVDAAFDLHRRSDAVTYQLQAMLLCDDLTIETIAENMALPVGTVKAYTALFFDVRPYLALKSRLHARLIAPLARTLDERVSMRLAALHLGYAGLRTFWEMGEHADPRQFQDAALHAVLRKFAAISMLAPIDRDNVQSFVRDALSYLKTTTANATDAAGRLSERRASLIQDLLTASKFTMIEGPDDVDLNPDEPRLFEKLRMENPGVKKCLTNG